MERDSVVPIVSASGPREEEQVTASTDEVKRAYSNGVFYKFTREALALVCIEAAGATLVLARCC